MALKTAIVNVATGASYLTLQDRLSKSLDAAGYGGRRLFWRDDVPPNSPSHRQSPYEFKAHAVDVAFERGADLVLWLDAHCRVLQPLDPLWGRLERDGVWMVADGWNCGQWSTDACLHAFQMDRSEAAGIQMNYACAMGFANTPVVRNLVRSWRMAADKGLFRGPWIFQPTDPEYEPANALLPDSMQGKAGHRHDQTCISILLHRFGLPMHAAEQFGSGDQAIVTNA
jgi:hypothetical protein